MQISDNGVKMESDLKRKTEDPISSTDQSEKHQKKPKLSSSSFGGDEKVRASHILIKHRSSRRKSSWKDPEGAVIRKTKRADAIAKLKSLRDDIVSGRAEFKDVAARFSDCTSAKRGGDLGSFGRGKMQKPFESAAFSLQIGEISDTIETDSGIHIIKRTG